MDTFKKRLNFLSAACVIRRLLLSWLGGACVEYCLLPLIWKDLELLDGLAAMSLIRLLSVTAVLFLCFFFWGNEKLERWLMTGFFGVLASVSLWSNFSAAYGIACLLLFVALLVYARKGWKCDATAIGPALGNKWWFSATIVLALGFSLFVSVWTVYRVLSFSTPTFDFGIFSQMFYNMRSTGLPMTTVERDGLLSHFHVHVSPIYYLLLPIYAIFPYPATLQILQAAVLASAVIPLWCIGKHHGLQPSQLCLVCLLLLFYPAYAGGTSYDIHENAFLTPLLLWLFYSVDRKRWIPSVIAAILTLLVKEDAAVYVAVTGLYYFVCGILHKQRQQALAGSCLAIISVVYFLAVTSFLSKVGDGVMTYRYSNFMFDGSDSLLSVVKAVILHPMKAVWECVNKEKLEFIFYTILPLGAIPLFTRQYQRYILLIPYILINLMSDYQYQHSIFFQYTYGSTACLIYLTVINIADIKLSTRRLAALGAALCIGIACFFNTVVPKAILYPKKYAQFETYYQQVQQTLDLIPDNASVSATTFYTTYLSSRPVLYDVQYASFEHLLESEYIVLSYTYTSAYKQYAANGQEGFDVLTSLLYNAGYSDFAKMDGTMLILHKG